MSAGPIEGAGKDQDVELNLAPILDAFTVLITFMLASASFLSIGVLDAGVAAPSASTENVPPPPIQITLKLLPNQDVVLEVTGKVKKDIRVSAKGAENPNFAELKAELGSLKQTWPTVDGLTLTAENSVQYQKIVKTMDEIRRIYPAVMLGGF